MMCFGRVCFGPVPRVGGRAGSMYSCIMTLTQQLDEILFCSGSWMGSGRWLTLTRVKGASHAMFGPPPPDDVLIAALDSEPSFIRDGDQYCVHLRLRAERLAAEFGFPVEE